MCILEVVVSHCIARSDRTFSPPQYKTCFAGIVAAALSVSASVIVRMTLVCGEGIMIAIAYFETWSTIGTRRDLVVPAGDVGVKRLHTILFVFCISLS